MTTIAAYDVAIVGGGIIGCALAESLSREGLRVVVLERGIIGREASWAAAGMIAPCAEMPEPGYYFDFCLAARRMYPEAIERIRAQTAIDPQYRDEGMIYFARNEAEEKVLRDRAAWQTRSGANVRILSPDEISEAVPAASGRHDFAVHFCEDHQIDPRLMTHAWAIAARQNGVELLEYTPVSSVLNDGRRVIGVETPQGKIHAQWTVLAGGAWSGLLAGLPVPVPTYPVKGQMLLLRCRRPLFDPTLHSADIYLVPRLDGHVIVGATEEHESGFDKSVQAGAATKLLGHAFDLVPGLRDAELSETWAGLRPGSPDRRPIMGATDMEGLALATGHFRNGILLAPLTAQLMTRYLTTRRLPDELKPFSIERFASRQTASAGS